MRFIAGLGNPGAEYSGSRHNAGFVVVRELARRWHLEWHDERQVARLARGRILEEVVTLIEPQLYMNRSGEALVGLGLEIDAADLVVVHDELDLPLGRIRVKLGGGSAGHRGVDSIMQHFGPDFVRIRVGIGKPPAGAETVDFVLAPFDADEQTRMAAVVGLTADAVEYVIEHGGQKAMSHFNVRRPVDGPTPVAAATKA